MPRKRRKPSLRRRLVRYALIAVVAFIAISVLLTLPLRWIDPVTTAFMRRDDSGRDPVLHEWVDWEDVGDWLPLAVVAAEDQRFERHHGIDFESITDSLADAQRGNRLRGASTITQQLAKNLYLWPGRSFLRKGLEAWLALNLDLFLPKRRILEIYLNVVELGPGIYGVSAASTYFLGKPPGEVGLYDAALMASVLPNPARLRVDAPSPYVRERQAWIASQMRRLARERWMTLIDP